MSHLLVVTYSGGVQKCRTIGELVRRHGYEVTMLTTNVREDLREDLPDGVSVHEVSDPKPLSLYRPFWTVKSIRAAREILHRRPASAVLSWHVPIASHIVAATVERRFNVPWIAHFGDPWLGNPYADGPLKNIIYQKRIERYIVNRASTVTVPTPRMAEMYRNRYSDESVKIAVVPNNIQPEEVESVEPYQRSDDMFQLVYTGSFYGIRSPEPLLKAVSQLDMETRNNLQVQLVGSLGDYESSITDYRVSDVIESVGRVPKDEALSRSKAADVLLLIDAAVENSPFLPTKLVEYLYMDVPILAITPDPGTAADVIKATNSGTVVPPDNPSAIAEAITRYYAESIRGTLSVEIDADERRQYSSREAVSRLADQLRAAVKTPPDATL